MKFHTLALVGALAAGTPGAKAEISASPAPDKALALCVGGVSRKTIEAIREPIDGQHTRVHAALERCRTLLAEDPDAEKALAALAGRDPASIPPAEARTALGAQTVTGARANRILEEAGRMLADMRLAGYVFPFVATTPEQKARQALNEREKAILAELSAAGGGILPAMARQALEERRVANSGAHGRSAAQGLGGVGLLGAAGAWFAWRWKRRHDRRGRSGSDT